MIILTRRALTKAESKIENGNFPTTVMLFNATVFEMKINKPTPRKVTQFVADYLSNDWCRRRPYLLFVTCHVAILTV